VIPLLGKRFPLGLALSSLLVIHHIDEKWISVLWLSELQEIGFGPLGLTKIRFPSFYNIWRAFGMRPNNL
jgi:hypothetical protein